MRGALVPLSLALAMGCAPPARQPLFAACEHDEDCELHWSCVPGASGRFCSERCSSTDDCELVRDGPRDANVCLVGPQDPEGACFMSCPEPGTPPDEGCEEFALPSRHRLLAGSDVCVCSP